MLSFTKEASIGSPPRAKPGKKEQPEPTRRNKISLPKMDGRVVIPLVSTIGASDFKRKNGKHAGQRPVTLLL
jgi:hypothetical protein